MVCRKNKVTLTTTCIVFMIYHSYLYCVLQLSAVILFFRWRTKWSKLCRGFESSGIKL